MRVCVSLVTKFPFSILKDLLGDDDPLILLDIRISQSKKIEDKIRIQKFKYKIKLKNNK